jgi:hypothetical protein
MDSQTSSMEEIIEYFRKALSGTARNFVMCELDVVHEFPVKVVNKLCPPLIRNHINVELHQVTETERALEPFILG